MYVYNLDLAVKLEKLYKHIGKFFLNNYGEFPYFSVIYHLHITVLKRCFSSHLYGTVAFLSERRLGDVRGWRRQGGFGNGEFQEGRLAK